MTNDQTDLINGVREIQDQLAQASSRGQRTRLMRELREARKTVTTMLRCDRDHSGNHKLTYVSAGNVWECAGCGHHHTFGL